MAFLFWGSQRNLAVKDLTALLSFLKDLKAQDPLEYWRRANDPKYQKPLKELMQSIDVNVDTLQSSLNAFLLATAPPVGAFVSFFRSLTGTFDNAFREQIPEELLPILGESLGLTTNASNTSIKDQQNQALLKSYNNQYNSPYSFTPPNLVTTSYGDNTAIFGQSQPIILILLIVIIAYLAGKNL